MSLQKKKKRLFEKKQIGAFTNFSVSGGRKQGRERQTKPHTISVVLQIPGCPESDARQTALHPLEIEAGGQCDGSGNCLPTISGAHGHL